MSTKYSNEKLIKIYEKDINILKNDLLKYGQKNKKVAEYDKKEISKCETEINKLKKEIAIAEIIDTKYNQQLKLIKYNNNLYSIDFDNSSVGYTLITDTSLQKIHKIWKELQNIIIELVELDMDYSKENIKIELERIHGNLLVDFNTLYQIRKFFL